MAAASARRTKIIATLGPATSSHERIAALVHAGMDCARLNFSHGTHEQHAETLRTLRAVQEEIGRAVAIMADLQGPKLRIGGLPEPVVLERGEHVDVVAGDAASNGQLPISPAVIAEVLQPGHEILIDDGLVPLPIPSRTRKDLDDLEFALAQEVDFVALSFVRSAADVRDLRGLIDQAGSHAAVVPKVEKAEAVEALDAIVADADALMVARGDLGVEIGPASVPLLQKRIIVRALENGKPVITATQMLESMVHQAEPTRAEASDVANAVLDGTSALMLSQETAIGEYPVAAVAYMDRIARAVEPSLDYRHQLPEASEAPSIGRAMSNAACDLAETLGATAILVPTYSGKTASAVARLRPRRPVVGLTHHRYALQQMALEWGVIPLEIPECENVEDLWSRSLDAVRSTGIVAPGDRVVITAGTAVNIPGTTNVIKVEVA